VVHPGQYQATRRIDARVRLLKDASISLRHNSEVKFFVGAAETIAAMRLLGTEELHPGEEGWIQLELRDPVVAVRGDRYIVRRPSPGETLGGGTIVDHQPRGRHKRFDENVLRSLESLSQGTPAEVLMEAALQLNVAAIKELVARSRLEATNAEAALKELLDQGAIVSLEAATPSIKGDALVVARPHWNALHETIMHILESYHAAYPLRRGIPREELKSRLKLPPRAFQAVIANCLSQDMLKEANNTLATPEHEVRFDNGQQSRVQALMRKLEQNPYSPPGVKELQTDVDE
jgi:selenocysteine-specific elongation factor